jgi:CheY-like chemotaxis protein
MAGERQSQTDVRRRPEAGQRRATVRKRKAEIVRVAVTSAGKKGHPAPRRRSRKVPVPAEAAPLRGNETVLVANDTPMLRRALARLLRGLGYRVLEAADALEAQRRTEAHPKIHLLLMDLSAPEPSDLQLALWFRATYPQTKVLVTSDLLWELNLKSGFAQEIAILAKPYTQVELARIVRRVLGRASAP